MLNLNHAFRPTSRWAQHTANVSAAVVLLISLGCLLTACEDHEKSAEPSQVAARVNSQDISVHQVEAVLQAQPGLVNRLGSKAVEKVLNSLIEQELAAQAAKASDLDHSPKVLQALELAKREVLARAYQDQLAARAVEPSSNEVDRYYDTKPDLFAQRRRFTLHDTVVDASASQLEALQARVQQMTQPDELEPALRSMGLRYSMRDQMRFAEELPAAVLQKIAPIATGHSVLVEREGGAEIFTLVSSESTPLSLTKARPIIKAFLMQERRRQRVEEGMKTLREAAKIEYVAKLMPAEPDASEPSAPSSAATASPDASTAASAP